MMNAVIPCFDGLANTNALRQVLTDPKIGETVLGVQPYGRPREMRVAGGGDLLLRLRCVSCTTATTYYLRWAPEMLLDYGRQEAEDCEESWHWVVSFPMLQSRSGVGHVISAPGPSFDVSAVAPIGPRLRTWTLYFGTRF